MGTEIEKLLIELRADVKDYHKEIKGAMKATDKSTKAMGGDFKKFAKESEKASSIVRTAMGTAAGFIGGQVVTGAFNRAFGAAKQFFNALVTDGVAAAQVQEDAVHALNTQLALNGDYSDDASRDMQEFAKNLQETTKVGDETTLQMLALAKTFGKSNEETKKMVEAAVELSAATGLTLEGSIKNLGKTFAGLTGELGESLPMLRELTVQQLKSGAAVDMLLSRFGGSAAAQIKTFSGAVQQLSNTWGDATEEIGFAFTENLAVIEVVKEVSAVIGEMTGAMSENQNGMQVLIGEGVVKLVEGLAGIIAGFDAAMRSSRMFADIIEKSFADVGWAITGVLKVFDSSYEESFKAFALQSKAAAENFKKRLTEDTAMGETATALLRIGDAAEEGLGKMKAGAEKAGPAIKNVVSNTKEFTEAQKQLAAAGREITDSLIGAQGDELSAVQAKYAALQAQREADLVNLQEYFEVKNELDQEQLTLETEALQMAREQGLITQAEHQAAKKALDDKYKAQRIKDENTFNKAMEALDQKTSLARVGIFTNTANLIAAVSKEGSKIAFLAQKAAGIAQSIVSTNVAAAQALASPPGPPFTIPLASQVKLAGRINTATIAATAIKGFREGTPSVPGFGTGDRVPAFLEPRERVVNRNTNDDLTNFLNHQKEMLGGFTNPGSGGGGGSFSIELSLKDELVEFIEAKIVERQATGSSLIEKVS